MVDKKHVHCKKCDYTWMTKSKAYWVCCPRCMNKVKIKINEGLMYDE